MDIEAVGVDISDYALRFGKNVVLADLLSLPFKNESFDFVFCRQVIEHMSSPEKLIREVYRILESNGLFYVDTPVTQTHSDVTHYHIHPKSYWKRILNTNGFEAQEYVLGRGTYLKYLSKLRLEDKFRRVLPMLRNYDCRLLCKKM